MEYKFRGKGIANNDWYYGDLIIAYDKDKVKHYYIITENYESKSTNIELNTCASPEVQQDTVGQYIGLKDKNGKEIYQGDIVQDISVYLTHKQYLEKGIETKEEVKKYKNHGEITVIEFDTENIRSCGCCYPQFTGTGFRAKEVDLCCCKVIRKYI